MTSSIINSWILSDKGVTVIVHGTPQTILSEHPSYNRVIEAIKLGNFDLIPKLISVSSCISMESGGRFEFVNGQMYFDGELVGGVIAKRIKDMLFADLPITSMVNFMQNLFDNPSYTVIDRLYEFMDDSQLPITPDGHILGYKALNANYTDQYTGKIDNSIGKIVSMRRSKVCDDHSRSCAPGLHFGSRDFFSRIGNGTMVLVKINPKDIVAIPTNEAKCRCCRYEVVADVKSDNAIEQQYIMEH